MLPDLVYIILAPLAVWRITHIIETERIASFLHRWAGDDPSSFFGYLVNCFLCLSVWVSFFIYICILVFPPIIVPFALSAVAIFINTGYEKWQ